MGTGTGEACLFLIYLLYRSGLIASSLFTSQNPVHVHFNFQEYWEMFACLGGSPGGKEMCCDQFSNLSLLVTKYPLPPYPKFTLFLSKEKILIASSHVLGSRSQSCTLISQECVVPSVQHGYGLSWFGNLDPQIHSVSHSGVKGQKEQQEKVN